MSGPRHGRRRALVIRLLASGWRIRSEKLAGAETDQDARHIARDAAVLVRQHANHNDREAERLAAALERWADE